MWKVFLFNKDQIPYLLFITNGGREGASLKGRELHVWETLVNWSKRERYKMKKVDFETNSLTSPLISSIAFKCFDWRNNIFCFWKVWLIWFEILEERFNLTQFRGFFLFQQFGCHFPQRRKAFKFRDISNFNIFFLLHSKLVTNRLYPYL